MNQQFFFLRNEHLRRIIFLTGCIEIDLIKENRRFFIYAYNKTKTLLILIIKEGVFVFEKRETNLSRDITRLMENFL